MDGITYMLVLVLVQLGVVVASSPIAKPNCKDECGGVKIPYPFGIGDGCFYNHTDSSGTFSYGVYYKITCDNTTNHPPTPIYGTDIPLLSISLDDHSFRINNTVAYDCYQNNMSSAWAKSPLSMVEFTVNTARNKFVAIGCDTKASISGTRIGKYYFTGCMTYCTTLEDIHNGTCLGVGCCESPVPDGTTKITSRVDSYYNHSFSPFNPCSAAFVVEDGAFNFSTANLTSPEDHFIDLRLPMVFDWSILSANCTTAGQDKLCGLNTDCIDGNKTNGYRCQCSSGYAGNPYLPQGCQDVNECEDPKLNNCESNSYCVDKEGGYDCRCPAGWHGNATKTDRCTADPITLTIHSASNLSTGVKVGIGKYLALFDNSIQPPFGPSELNNLYPAYIRLIKFTF